MNNMQNRNFYEMDFKQFREQRHKKRVFFGIIIAIIGLGLILTNLGLLPCLSLEYSWPLILILIGVFIGIKNSFRNVSAWVLIIIGIAYITPQFTILGRSSQRFVWPFTVLVAGLVIALRPRKERCYPRGGAMSSSIFTESNLNIDVTFGGRKEVVTSKDFRGGVVTVTFSGCEINLAQADSTQPAMILDCRVSFGGVEIIVPSHWEIQNEINPSFGSVEDMRTVQTATTSETKKTLILRGSCSFGSIEIKSY
jgi:predicted membrane protein